MPEGWIYRQHEGLNTLFGGFLIYFVNRSGEYRCIMCLTCLIRLINVTEFFVIKKKIWFLSLFFWLIFDFRFFSLFFFFFFFPQTSLNYPCFDRCRDTFAPPTSHPWPLPSSFVTNVVFLLILDRSSFFQFFFSPLTFVFKFRPHPLTPLYAPPTECCSHNKKKIDKILKKKTKIIDGLITPIPSQTRLCEYLIHFYLATQMIPT